MANLAGIISQHAKLDIDSTGQLRKMLRLMRHRGADNTVVRTLYDDCGAVGANEINLSPRRTHCTSLEDTAKSLRELVIDAVSQRMDGVGAISLSGGLDIPIVAAIAKQFNPNLILFTGTIAKAPGPDLENARRMAKYLDLEHRIYEISDEDNTNFIPEAIWFLESFDEDCVSGLISNYYVSKMDQTALQQFPPSYEQQTVRWGRFK